MEHYCIEVLEAEHCCIEVAEHCCIELAAELEKGPHLPEVLKPQGLPVGLGAGKVERAFGDFEQGKNRCSW